MTIPTIAFIRDTPLLSDALVQSYVAAQQIQISRDFAPLWGLDATCVFVPGGEVIPAGAWCIYFKDHSSEAGALGFHDDEGNPTSYVFVADALADGNSWTVTASHEVLEMLADPLATKTIVNGDFEYAWEVCDACEDDEFSYPVGGHHLTDFVLPCWFYPAAQGPFTMCCCPEITAPFMLAPGGYIGRRSIGGAWEQFMGPGSVTSRMRKGPTSRTMRRFASA